MNTMVQFRKIDAIAKDIRYHWRPVYFGAVPYLAAMGALQYLSDMYYGDSAISVVSYFLANATTWKGEDARRIKKELNDMIKRYRATR